MNDDRGMFKYLPIALAVILGAFGIARLLQRQRKPRSFREDPIGALKDRGEIVAGKAQDASEEALARLQAALDDLRERLPEVNRKTVRRGRKEANRRIGDLASQAQDLVKELRTNGVFSR